MAYDFLKNKWSNFERDILDKKLFLFGASQKCQKFMQRYGERLGGRIEAICDNNYTKQGQLLDSIIEKRNNGIKVWYDLNDHTGYFDTGIVELKPGDSFIDGGAYIGDTVDEALSRAEIKKIWAYEPDEQNYHLLAQKYGKQTNITCKCAGLWSDNGVLSFNSVGNIGSSIKEGGSVRIQTIALDKDIDEEVNFIKLDIEGAEIEALTGAEQLIKKYRPKLAICVYHKQEDLWKIPLLIKKMVPEYHIYLRHQSDYFYDTVMFAYV